MEEIPALVPFVAPEALEARLGVRFRLRLGANESVFGPSPKAVVAMREPNPAYYGDPQATALRSALAQSEGVRIENVAVAGGIDELLSLFCRAFLNPGDVVVTTLGSYPTFEFGARGAGALIERVPYRHDRPDLEGLLKAVQREGAKLVYLANPDNPSGALLSRADIEAFRAALPAECLFLLDEAYADFVPVDGRPVLASDDPGLVRLRTFSKAHGLAGLRVGFALAAPENVAALDKIRMHFGLNAVGLAAALASLGDLDHLAWVVAETAKGRERLASLARRYGLRPLPSSTNFVALDAGTRERAERLLDALLRQGVFVRKPAQPPLDRCVRISVGRAEDLELLAEILPTALSES